MCVFHCRNCGNIFLSHVKRCNLCGSKAVSRNALQTWHKLTENVYYEQIDETKPLYPKEEVYALPATAVGIKRRPARTRKRLKIVLLSVGGSLLCSLAAGLIFLL